MSSKYWVVALATLLTIGTTSSFVALVANAQSDDVFLDEGDADFDTMPILPPEAKEAPRKAASAPPPAAPAPAQVAAPSAEELALDELTPESSEETSVAEDEPSAPAESKAVKQVAPKKETPKKVAAPKAPAPKKTAIKKASAPGRKIAGKFVTTNSPCPMLSEPTDGSSEMLTVKPSRKIWVEVVDDSWYRGFNRAGEPGYLKHECFN